ncbi:MULTISPECIES: RNA polymerase sigma factor [Streptomyces]|uniref:RNA polymerase sigma factor n=1 Tax=Streptomyces TaxID=1883 RepID=UPI001646984D|nr:MULTISPECIES: sigma-70 family RNA polymerase sigma factor [Streptomyces]MBT3078364.1 sigma-70 family RNA polymerase sigma factor [Streptomyces sp. COG21]MBT3087686.1 sigma-70 family RNA polymerase sigma factor [Streptomyces sp. CYG21]MBT3099392.1 sigma-70 family RNA polymerase sigma factor [Streptomyces sp. CBG30]MBT3104008.1 sigma-70 family RNA polymerase sigma factor [Streptomyces sp. COG19]MBT3113414.1 sigma-70 family RNA polymerase sigma factor [Streptomyces sp. CYG20]
MNGSDEQDSLPAKAPPAQPSPEQRSELSSDDPGLRLRDTAIAAAPSARPPVHRTETPTDVLDEDHIVLSTGSAGRMAFAAAPAPQAPTLEPPRTLTTAPSLEAFFVRENFERTRRAIGVLLFDDRTQAEDITQEAFVIVFERWDRVSMMDNPLGYTIKVAWRLALRWLQARNRKRALDAALTVPAADGASEAEAVIARADLTRAFLRLSPAHQEVLTLSMSDLDPQDIAPLLGIPVPTVRTRLFRARRALSALLDDPPEAQS